MEEYFKIFDPQIPSIIYQLTFVIFCLFTTTLFIVKKDLQTTKKWVLIALVVIYAFLTLCSTVFCRKIGTEYKLLLIPFWNYNDIIHGDTAILAEKLLNIALFIPLGFLLGGILGKDKFWQVVLMGCLFSVSIELLQLFLKRGFCEVDDVIHNTLGTMVGYGVWRGVEKIAEKGKI